MWQPILVALALLAAIGYLVRRQIKRRAALMKSCGMNPDERGGGGGCKGCG